MKSKIFSLLAFVSGCSAMISCNSGITAPDEVELPRTYMEAMVVEVESQDEVLKLSSDSHWFGVVEEDALIQSGEEKDVRLWFEPNFSTAQRSGVITVKNADGRRRMKIKVTQDPYFDSIHESMPSRLECQKNVVDLTRWEQEGICSPAEGQAVLTAVSVNGNTPVYKIDNGPNVADLGVGDYLLYAVPTEKIEAGEQVDFMLTVTAKAVDSPKYFIFEYWDDGQWKCVEKNLLDAEDIPSVRYSFYNKYFKSAHVTTYAESFTLTKPVVNDCLKVRLRILSEGRGATGLPGSTANMNIHMVNYPDAPEVVDSTRILFIGNSFTYYYSCPFMFKEIARSQGHYVEAIISVKGGQEFCEHLERERSIEAINRGGFDYAFLQDTSPNAAIYADKGTPHILEASREINALTMASSPDCQIIYEQTWGCWYDNYRGYGDMDKLDHLINTGVEKIVSELGQDIWISPINDGFRLGREAELPLYHKDRRHQSREGAYMKACINYLLLYRAPFTETVSDCAVEPEVAAKIREIAEQVVLK